MRLIDGQAAIDAIQKRRFEAWDEYKDDQEYRFGYDDGAADTMKMLAELPSAQPELNTQLYTDGFNDGYVQCKKDKTQWIPCSERQRLPTGQGEVIVSCRDDAGDSPFDYTASGWVTPDGEYWIVDNEINHYVVAWMPLPKPWKD